MDEINMNEKLISKLLDCADALTKMANNESLTLDKTASTIPVKTERTEYMSGIMQGLGLEE